ncbi:hypothetical protein V5O48_012583 [Marasmius crinis-equi]|uniref:Uncharacterized protein n=1 Tax=Marasmius crinis-equi TaxID=585013 RepID=A0ABR3F2E9_9AGAR
MLKLDGNHRPIKKKTKAVKARDFEQCIVTANAIDSLLISSFLPNMAQFFSNSSQTKIGNQPVFQHVSGDAITNNNMTVIHKSQWCQSSTSLEEDEGSTSTTQHTLRKIDTGDIILRKEVSSWICDIVITTQTFKSLKPTNPFRGRLQAVRVRKRVFTAEIIRKDVRDLKFTVVTFEPEDPNDREKVSALVLLDTPLGLHVAIDKGSDVRSPRLTQLFGMGRSDTPVMILHDELVDGWTLCSRYLEAPIIKFYIIYTAIAAMGTLADDEMLTKMGIPYDLPSILILETNEDDYMRELSFWPIPFPQDIRPEDLEPHCIIAHFERCFGDFMYTCSVRWSMKAVLELSDFACHDLLTFGTVVDYNNPAARILGHFPSVPHPIWECITQLNSDVNGSCSELGESCPGLQS